MVEEDVVTYVSEYRMVGEHPLFAAIERAVASSPADRWPQYLSNQNHSSTARILLHVGLPIQQRF